MALSEDFDWMYLGKRSGERRGLVAV